MSAALPLALKDHVVDEVDLKSIVAHQVAKLELDLENERALIGLRKKFGRNLLRFLWWYFVATFLLIAIDAIDLVPFSIPPFVATAMVGGTAVSVLGVVGTIAAGLFREPKR